METKQMGVSKRTYQDIINFTTAAITRTDIIELYNVLRKSILEYQLKPNRYFEIKMVAAYQKYAETMWKKHVSHLRIPNYKTHFSVYDDQGNTYFDSKHLSWKVVSQDMLTNVQLVPKEYYERPCGAEKCELLYLNKKKQTPFLLNQLHPTLRLPQSSLLHSQYAVDPRETMETIMASHSPINHYPVETPHYLSVKYGFSARPAFPGKGEMGHHVCINIRVLVLDRQGKEQCIASFYVKVGIEQEISENFTTLLAHSNCSSCEEGDWSIRTR